MVELAEELTEALQESLVAPELKIQEDLAPRGARVRSVSLQQGAHNTNKPTNTKTKTKTKPTRDEDNHKSTDKDKD